MTEPEPRPGGRPARGRGRAALADSVVRVTLVLLLLGLAAHGLASRRSLDWGAVSDAPGTAWAGIALFALAGGVVVLALRTILKYLRSNRRMVQEDDDLAPVSEAGSNSPWMYLAGFAVIAVTLVICYYLLKQAMALQPHYVETRFGKGNNTRPAVQATTDPDQKRAALLAGATVTLAVVHSVLRRRAAQQLEQEDEEDDGRDEHVALAGAVAAAEEELDSHGDDTRAAIIAAYLAMEKQLTLVGTARLRSDTPTEFLLRATERGGVSRGAAERLTDLFREARFSTHPMPTTARQDAARALGRISEDLTRGSRTGV